MSTKISYGILVLSLIISSAIITIGNKNNQTFNSQVDIVLTNIETIITPTQIIANLDTKKNDDTNVLSPKISAEIITSIISLTPTLQSTPSPTTVPTPTATIIPTSTLLYPEKIKINVRNLSLFINQSKKLYVEYEPKNTVNKKVTWSVDDGSILKVTTDGLVTALDSGVAYVSVTNEQCKTDKIPVSIYLDQEVDENFQVLKTDEDTVSSTEYMLDDYNE